MLTQWIIHALFLKNLLPIYIESTSRPIGIDFAAVAIPLAGVEPDTHR